MKLVFATHNPDKLREVQELLGEQIELLSLNDLSLFEEIPETSATLEGNALLKAQYVQKKKGCDVFADDTGLEVAALNGEPGVFSARYAGPQKDATDNMDKLLRELQEVSDRSARFRTVIALLIGGEEHLFEGVVEGRITLKKSGAEGFGYDPIFLPNDSNRTFAEMGSHEKNRISHRGRAIEKLVRFLRNRQG